jgi:hypothetical protein
MIEIEEPEEGTLVNGPQSCTEREPIMDMESSFLFQHRAGYVLRCPQYVRFYVRPLDSELCHESGFASLKLGRLPASMI